LLVAGFPPTRTPVASHFSREVDEQRVRGGWKTDNQQRREAAIFVEHRGTSRLDYDFHKQKLDNMD